jgi:hypothetical protein
MYTAEKVPGRADDMIHSCAFMRVLAFFAETSIRQAQQTSSSSRATV